MSKLVLKTRSQNPVSIHSFSTRVRIALEVTWLDNATFGLNKEEKDKSICIHNARTEFKCINSLLGMYLWYVLACTL